MVGAFRIILRVSEMCLEQEGVVSIAKRRLQYL